jgi:hypothetical protein
MKCCPTCGQELPKIGLPEGLTLNNGDYVIYNAVQRAGKNGLSSTRLVDILYGADPDGGPQDASSVARKRICDLNRKLRPFKQRLLAPRGAGGPKNYVLHTLE